MSDKILVIDDEISICELLKLELELEGYICETANNGDDALIAFKEFKPDLVLLDLMLPGMSGYELCEEFVSRKSVPIIMLTAKSEIDDIVVGLETGADDYVTKPFDTRELLARIKALIKRYRSTGDIDKKEFKNGPLVIFPDSQSAYINNRQVKLTVTEFEILMLFMQHPDKVYTRESLARELGIKDFDGDTRSIDMHIQRLRRKMALFTDLKYIETVFGLGYKMRNFDETEIQQ